MFFPSPELWKSLMYPSRHALCGVDGSVYANCKTHLKKQITFSMMTFIVLSLMMRAKCSQIVETYYVSTRLLDLMDFDFVCVSLFIFTKKLKKKKKIFFRELLFQFLCTSTVYSISVFLSLNILSLFRGNIAWIQIFRTLIKRRKIF